MKLPRYSGKLKKLSAKIPFYTLRQVAGESMLPVLRAEQLILCRVRPGSLRVRDVVIIRHNGTEKIKRIHKLTPTKVWVEGDNPQKSTDSRSFGWLSVHTIVAQVVWPSV